MTYLFFGGGAYFDYYAYHIPHIAREKITQFNDDGNAIISEESYLYNDKYPKNILFNGKLSPKFLQRFAGRDIEQCRV